MTPLPNLANVIAVSHRFSVGADQNVNSKLHFRYTGAAPAVADLTTLAGQIHTAYVANLKPRCANDIQLNAINVQDLSDMTKPLGIWTGAEGGGTGGTRNLPASACVVIGYRIARRYRGGHPRGYWPLLSFTDMNGPAHWSTTAQTSMKTAFDAYVTALKALTTPVTIGAQCSISYYSHGAWSITTGRPKYTPVLRTPPLVDDVTNTAVALKLGSQRRRLKTA